jgi:hypothetical protein
MFNLLNSLYPLLIKIPLRSQVHLVKIACRNDGTGKFFPRYTIEAWENIKNQGADWLFLRKFEIQEIPLPIWLAPEDYIKNQFTWDALWHMCPKTAFNAQIQRRLVELYRNTRDPHKIYLCLQLLAREESLTEFKSSLLGTLKNWLTSRNSPYDSPFSWKQWAALGDSKIKQKSSVICQYNY